MKRSINNITKALAGIFQASSLVQQSAVSAIASDPYFTTSIDSIFALSPDSIDDIFPEQVNLQLGLTTLISVLTRTFNDETEQKRLHQIGHYFISLMQLERKFVAQKEKVRNLRDRIEQIQRQKEHFPTTHETIIAALADAYEQNISCLPYQIHVSGKSEYLRQTHNFERIRALLLAGMRSAVLWRQFAGNRWHFLIKRKAIIHCAKRLSEENNAKK